MQYNSPMKTHTEDRRPSQARRIADKFGGVPALAKALAELAAATNEARHAREISVIYRWNLPRETGGAGGLVPSSAMQSVLAAAKRQGILLTAEDTAPTRG
jgi:hypothetical protein